MKKKLDLTIVIPTLNEEKYIGKLLDSIIAQTVWPEYVVVVDACSPDHTIDEIKKRQIELPQLQYFQIPKSTISTQRNFGARKTDTKHLLFLDADVCLADPQTLEKYINEVEMKKPDIAAATNLPLSKFWKNKVYFKGIDTVFRAAKPIYPMAMAINMYLSRHAFEQSGGFDENVKFAEDHEIVKRLKRNGKKFIFLDAPKVYTSTRRMDEEGRTKYSLRMLQSLYYILKVGYRKSPADQRYGHF